MTHGNLVTLSSVIAFLQELSQWLEFKGFLLYIYIYIKCIFLHYSDVTELVKSLTH